MYILKIENIIRYSKKDIKNWIKFLLLKTFLSALKFCFMQIIIDQSNL